MGLFSFLFGKKESEKSTKPASFLNIQKIKEKPKSVEFKEVTTVEEAVRIINLGLENKNNNINTSIQLQLNSEDYDLLAEKFPKLKLYFDLKVVVKFPQNLKAKTYLTQIESFTKKFEVIDLEENGIIYHTITSTLRACNYKNELPQSLHSFRNVTAIYRGNEYPFSKFKSAIYYYDKFNIKSIEEYFINENFIPEKKVYIPSYVQINRLNKGVLFKKGNSTIQKFDFVAIDFETSNRNHSVCSVGVVAIKDGEIKAEKHWFVCPKSSHFEHWNVDRHGITYEKVKNEPYFDEVWEELQYYVVGEKLVAHNAASTDITCLRKSFLEYNIEGVDLTNYDCTLKLSRILLPQLMNHQLPTVVNHFGLDEFQHHDALEDARICAKVYLELEKLFILNCYK